jgi:hypothetical protein
MGSASRIPAESDGQTAWELPPLQWTKDLDAGYISTAPLVTDGIVIVKVGGRSDIPNSDWEQPPGLFAFRADNGELAWRYKHPTSTTGFELSPILRLWASNGSACASDGWPDMILNGWTDGSVTANWIGNGTLAWKSQTERSASGVTGSLQVSNNWDSTQESPDIQLLVPGERGLAGFCPADGSSLWNFEYGGGGVTGYRNGIGEFSQLNPENGTIESRFAVGDEQGRLHLWRVSDADHQILDLPQLLGLEGKWQIRAPPVYLGTPDYDNWTRHLAIVLQGQTEGRLVILEFDRDLNHSILRVDALAGSPAMFVGWFQWQLTGDAEGLRFTCAEEYGCRGAAAFNGSPVSGEIRHNSDSFAAGIHRLSAPHNAAHGSWTGYTVVWNETGWDIRPEWVWVPQRAGWLTAGVGGAENVLAAGNDASWLEVRFADSERQGLSAAANSTLSETSSDQTAQQPATKPSAGATSEQEGPSIKQKQTSESSTSMLQVLAVCLVLLGLGGLCRWDSNSIRVGSLLLIVGLVLGAPTLISEWSEVAQDLMPSEPDERPSFPQQWNNTQIVCFEFPDDLWNDADGIERLLDPSGELIEERISNVTRTCVGGLEGYSDVLSASEEAARIAGFDLNSEQQLLGLLVEDIGPAAGGDGNRWWLYWLDGQHPMLAADIAEMQADSLVEWRFL